MSQVYSYPLLRLYAMIEDSVRIEKGTAMYNGYTESDEKVKARFERRCRLHEAIMKAKQEAEAIPVELPTPVMVAE